MTGRERARMSETARTFALDGKTSLGQMSGHCIDVCQITDRGMIDLRGEPGDKRFTSAARRVLGVDLPQTPRTSHTGNGVTVLWLSVDQWLVCGSLEEIPALASGLAKALAGVHHQVCDMSDARSILQLKGDGAREVIMKSAPVDLTTGGYARGGVRRLRYAGVAGMVHLVDTGPDVIDLYVFRSHAEHVWNWLEVTARTVAAVKVFGKQPTPAV